MRPLRSRARRARVRGAPVAERRRHSRSPEPSAERWVIPYADMLTLLMGLFLVLWAIGNQDLAKMKEFTQGF